MLGHTALPPDAGLGDVLVTRARASSDARLAADVAGGLIVLVGISAWRPRGWLLVAGAALCFAAFGAWGILDRELSVPNDTRAHWRVRLIAAGRAAAAALGFLAAAVLLVQVLGLALGTWIS